jgi:ABC-type uncharacterized transport system substrate-binding protein
MSKAEGWGFGQYERLPELAADLVRQRVSVIAATGGVPSVRAAKMATSAIPIVFTMGGDPVAFGIVASRHAAAIGHGLTQAQAPRAANSWRRASES